MKLQVFFRIYLKSLYSQSFLRRLHNLAPKPMSPSLTFLLQSREILTSLPRSDLVTLTFQATLPSMKIVSKWKIGEFEKDSFLSPAILD